MTDFDRRHLLAATLTGGAALAAGGTAAAPATASPAPAAAPRPAAARPAPAPGPLRVHLVAFDGVEELDLFGPLEVFALAAALGRPVVPTLVTTGRPGRVRASFGTQIEVPGRWDPSSADAVVVLGGGYRKRDGAGVWAEIDKGTLPQGLRRAVRPGLTLVGVCTGVFLLHAAGLLDGRPCTTHVRAKQDLRDLGHDVRDARVVDDGDLVCAGGVSSGIDAALWLLERELGPEAASGVETLLEFERRGTVLRTA
ncbi:DJ-1/PfpI family protein [Streptomyces sp. Ag109_G2-6]|uniref:DJ-1/PfpI family protein n=1 Tax=Streptomyces TaxID=1883 RepID=UPI0009A4940F|nr:MULTISPECIES: DJ-1/PfpI family protein [Streptomyces]RPF25504.1 DJ-1/PfpI family protein [Streptomyces sp. Ag109_G2-6]